MTLIIGHASSDIGFLVADTLLTFPYTSDDARNPEIEKFHALKIQILTPDVAVAFAGNVMTSLAIIRALSDELAVDRDLDVPQRIFDLRRTFVAQGNGGSHDDCEFLVLVLGAEGKLLAHVDGDRIDRVQRAYIGDSEEYKQFTSLIEPYSGPESRLNQNVDGTISNVPQPVTEGEKEFDQTADALEKLTYRKQGTTIGAVCGCITRVVDARISRKLEYLQSVEVSHFPWEGHGGFSLLAANADPRGVGLYYRGWHKGWIFIVGDPVTCREEAAETIDEFVELARSKYGLHWKAGTGNHSTATDNQARTVALRNIVTGSKPRARGGEGRMLQRTIKAVIRAGEQAGYVAECVEIPVVTQGRTLDEVSQNLREAVNLHLADEDLADLGLTADPTIIVTMELTPEHA